MHTEDEFGIRPEVERWTGPEFVRSEFLSRGRDVIGRMDGAFLPRLSLGANSASMKSAILLLYPRRQLLQ